MRALALRSGGVQACRMAHLDRPYKDWALTVGSVPADAMRLPHHGRIAPGLPANLVLFKGRGYSELLARPQWDRVRPSCQPFCTHYYVLSVCLSVRSSVCLSVCILVCIMFQGPAMLCPGFHAWLQWCGAADMAPVRTCQQPPLQQAYCIVSASHSSSKAWCRFQQSKACSLAARCLGILMSVCMCDNNKTAMAIHPPDTLHQSGHNNTVGTCHEFAVQQHLMKR